MTRADLLDPAILASLGHIELTARWIVDGFMSGLHRSPRKGGAAEFAEHRAYLPGDELRYLDWKVAARSDRLVVKRFEEETNLRATIVLDVSRSMRWTGSDRRLDKLAYAERLTAAISLLYIRQRDAVGLLRFDDAIRTAVPPRAREGHWQRLIAALATGDGGGASAGPAALARAAHAVGRRGMIVLVSDLLMETDDVARAARALRASGHQLVVLHIMDPAERSLEPGPEAVYVDPETGLEVPVAPAEVRDAYAATVERAIADWRRLLTGAGAGYATVMTDAPFGIPLRAAFAAREGLA
ncbi:MAG: DUF58 domain-containing protein [Gemmatimonadaceae bacterium]|nr:DUF58 domain-containing protein [Gemmatimonadaceae bacterium]NUQ92784.1 DUF58 domain-containing protein [Gemmatimonadaceae bacterium]